MWISMVPWKIGIPASEIMWTTVGHDPQLGILVPVLARSENNSLLIPLFALYLWLQNVCSGLPANPVPIRP